MSHAKQTEKKKREQLDRNENREPTLTKTSKWSSNFLFQPPLFSLRFQFCLSSRFSASCVCFSKSLDSLFPSARGYTVQYVSLSFCRTVMAVLVSVAITLLQNDYSSPDSLFLGQLSPPQGSGAKCDQKRH